MKAGIHLLWQPVHIFRVVTFDVLHHHSRSVVNQQEQGDRRNKYICVQYVKANVLYREDKFRALLIHNILHAQIRQSLLS